MIRFSAWLAENDPEMFEEGWKDWGKMAAIAAGTLGLVPGSGQSAQAAGPTRSDTPAISSRADMAFNDKRAAFDDGCQKLVYKMYLAKDSNYPQGMYISPHTTLHNWRIYHSVRSEIGLSPRPDLPGYVAPTSTDSDTPWWLRPTELDSAGNVKNTRPEPAKKPIPKLWEKPNKF